MPSNPPFPRIVTAVSPLNPKAEQVRALKGSLLTDTSAQFLFAVLQLFVDSICDACMALAAGPNPAPPNPAANAAVPVKTVATRIDFLMCSPFLFLPQDTVCRQAPFILQRPLIASASSLFLNSVAGTGCSRRLARAAAEAGGDVTLEIGEGLPHVCQLRGPAAVDVQDLPGDVRRQRLSDRGEAALGQRGQGGWLDGFRVLRFGHGSLRSQVLVVAGSLG